MASSAETIKERLDIAEVVGMYVKLEKAGENYKARCPFHNEKTPSFYVSPRRKSYYCFGCAAKGDIFTFVQEFEKVDFVGALKILAERAGVELQQFRNEKTGEHERLRGVLELATAFYEGQLSRNKKAYEYLTSRGLTDKTIKDWRLGYAADEWRLLHDHLISKRVTEADMEAAGLIKISEKDTVKEGGRTGVIYDRFRGRVMFPLFDPSSRVVGYSGRIFGVEEREGNPKYLNSPDGELFNKSEILYGYHKAKEGIRQWGYAILVEGQMDLLMCHQAGYTNAVATSGTSLTPQHLDKLRKISDNLMLVYDADKAGLKATLRAWTGALSIGMDVKVAALPLGDDPASLLLKDKEEFKKALKNSKHIIDYYLDILSSQFSNGPDQGSIQGISEGQKEKFHNAVHAEVLPYVAAVESAIERSHIISRISVRTGLYESDIREEVGKIRQRQQADAQMTDSKAKTATGQQDQHKGSASERVGERVAERIGSQGSPPRKDKVKEGHDTVLRRITGLMLWLGSRQEQRDFEYLKAGLKKVLTEDEMADVERSLETKPEELIFEAELIFNGSSKIQEDMDELLLELEERLLKERLSRAMSELQISEKRGDRSKTEEILKICQNLSLELSALNKKRRDISK